MAVWTGLQFYLVQTFAELICESKFQTIPP